MNAPKVGSLFSGYGGLDLAVHMAIPGSKIVWVSDVEPGPNKILVQRFPDAPNLGDITTIDWDQVEPVDILVGGSPCQDLSAAGQRAGMKPGTRSGLWESMTHAINHLHPRLVVWENVLGALSASAYSKSDMEPRAGFMGNRPDGPVLRALGRVLGDLTNLGYDAEWTTVRAADVGAPHGRRRVFVVAYPSGERPQGWLDSRFSSHGKGTPGDGYNLASLPRDVALLPTPKAGDADFGLPRTSGRPPEKSTHLATRIAYDIPLLRTPCAAEAEGGPLHPEVAKARNQTLRLTGQVLAATGNLADASGNTDTSWGDYAPAIHRWEQVLGRPAPEPTEPSRTGKPQLSAKFVEWMMGLPSGWVTGVDISRAQQLRALGNGVVPQQGAAAITHLLGRKETTNE